MRMTNSSEFTGSDIKSSAPFSKTASLSASSADFDKATIIGRILYVNALIFLQ